jgi:hypothetical protein
MSFEGDFSPRTLRKKADCYCVRLLRMYSAAFVLSGKGFVGTSLISLATLDATLSDLFMAYTYWHYELFWYLSSICPISNYVSSQKPLCFMG